MRRIGMLAAAMSAALWGSLVFVGCSDDSSSGQSCGNGVIEGTEECDGSDLNGQTCQDRGFAGGVLGCTSSCTFDVSQCSGENLCGNGQIDQGEDCDGTNLNDQTCQDVGNYSGGTLRCTAECTFDMTQCEAATNCGNGVIDEGEECDGMNTNGQTCQDVGNYGGGTLRCTAECTFDTTQCEAATNCGNGVIDEGEECDGMNTNGQTCQTVDGSYVGGSLVCADDCTFDVSGCWPGPGVSDEIATARSTSDGTALSLPIDGAVVTMTVPAVGTAPAGFFIQAAQPGPALFVAVDPTTLSPAPAAGDVVGFTITQMGTIYQARQALAISDFQVLGSGYDVSSLYQDVNQATDLVSALDDYESEVISLSADVVGEFGFAGTGFVAAQIQTSGITGEPNFLIRMPESVRDELDLATGCTVDVVGTPMWRYNDRAQVGLWYAANATVTSCPAPKVVSAVATASDTVVVTLDRFVAPGSITDAASQITFDNGLSATGASVDGRTILVTTTAQAPGQQYTVTLAATITDTLGTGVDQTANQADFLGYTQPALVAINEVNANIASGCDLIELRVISGGSMDGYSIKERNSTILTFTGLMVDTNDFVIVHLDGNDVANCNLNSSGNETASIIEHPTAQFGSNFDQAWDWYSTDTGLTRTNNVIQLLDNQGVIMDAVLLANESDCTNYNSASASESAAADVAEDGEWTAPDGTVPAGGFVNQTFCENAAKDLDGTGTDRSGDSIQRNGNTDTNTMNDWTQTTSTWAALNPGQTAF